MKYLFRHLRKISPSITKASHIYLFLDYDGTLTPIVARPELANLPRNVKSLLLKLIRNPVISIAIISGRSIKQLKQKIKIKDIVLAGNHGLEIELPTLKFIHPLAKKCRPSLKQIKDKLIRIARPVKGTFVEDKELTLSIHFRLAKEKDIKKLKQHIYTAINPYIRHKRIKVTHGKKVLEIRPPVRWDKGSLAGYLLRIKKSKARKALPIYIGDDKTDESAFRVLRKKGITVFVGRPNAASNAEYYVKNTEEVFKFLRFFNSPRLYAFGADS